MVPQFDGMSGGGLQSAGAIGPFLGSREVNSPPALTPVCLCLQLLDLFLQWDWSTYLADYGKPTCKYLRVNPHTALALLEK